MLIINTVNKKSSKAGLTLNDLYDTTFMTENRLSHFYGVYTITQVVHTKFIKVVLKDYSSFKSSSKMIQEQAAAASNNCANFREKEVREKEEEYSCNILLRMTFENLRNISTDKRRHT